MLEKPVLGKITQGTIFTAACSENYQSKPVWGLCITARCDVVHENKAQVFNYVPIVRYDDWLLADGGRIILDRIYVELLNAAKNTITSLGKSDTVFDSYDPIQIANTFFPGISEKADKATKRFHETAALLMSIQALRSRTTIELNKLTSICESQKKITDKAVRELWSNKLLGYYFIPTVGETENNSNCGYVALLREIHHIPRSVASAIGNGLSKEDIKMSSNASPLCFDAFDFSYPTGKLKSPWIEHLMQQFSLLFTRIGLPDPTVSTLSPLIEAIKHVHA